MLSNTASWWCDDNKFSGVNEAVKITLRRVTVTLQFHQLALGTKKQQTFSLFFTHTLILNTGC